MLQVLLNNDLIYGRFCGTMASVPIVIFLEVAKMEWAGVKFVIQILGLSPRDFTTKGINEKSHGALLEKINEVLATLPSAEGDVIRLCYGLGDGHCYTIEQVADIFRISARVARRIERLAMRNLQEPVRAKKLREALDECLCQKD